MVLKKVSNKAKIAKHVLVSEGALSLAIRSLQKIQKNSPPSTETHLDDIYTKAKIDDIIGADFYNKPKIWSTKASTPPYSFLWIMPPPGKGSGGHLNIFRFIKCLEDAGHTCEILLDLADVSGSVEHVKAVMDGYPEVKAKSTMRWISDGKAKLASFDGIFATSWETAYASYNLDSSARRFYFVQDYEPFFYPVGSLYYLAENTYKFNFFGVTAGGWLSEKLNKDFGMRTASYNFGSDGNRYFITNKGVRKCVFFYARPYTERRGFEMGMMALDLFHKMHPDYTILFAGWDVSNYKIPFPYENLKTLQLSELNDVYNRCAAGLILSYTNMSLLPLEIMAAGAIPVVNDAPNNRLVSNNKHIAYTNNDPASMANQLSKIVTNKKQRQYSIEASKSAHGADWKVAEAKFLKIVIQELSNND